MRKIVASTVLVLATATACSGGGGTSATSSSSPSPTFSAQEQAAITSLTTAFTSGRLTLKTDATSAGCVATGLVSQLGIDKLQSYKVIKSTMDATRKGLGAVAMTEADANVTAGVVLGCVPPLTAVQKLATDSGMKKKQARCLATKLTPDALKLMFVSYLDQQVTLDKSVTKALRACT